MKTHRFDVLLLASLFIFYLYSILYLMFDETKTTTKYEYMYSLSEDLRTFVNVSNVHNMKIFVIEPNFIYNRLNYKEKLILKKRNLISPDLYFYSGKVVDYLTFGVFDSYLTEIQNNTFLEALEEHGFNYSIDFNDKYKSLFDYLLREVTVLHIFVKKGETLIAQITVFYESNSWLWTGQTNDHSIELKTQFGKYDQLFDVFTVSHSSSSLSYANDVQFVMNLQFSKYSECNYSLALKVNKSIESWKHESKTKITQDALDLMKRLSNKLIIPFFLMGGTLLGWYRNCDIISYDKDNDFAAYGQYASYEVMKEIKETVPKYEYALVETFGLPDTAYELRVIKSNPKSYKSQIDIFFLYENSSESYFCGYHYDLKFAFIKLVYPKRTLFPLCSAIFLSKRTLVPCNTESYLRHEYGRKWYKANPKAHYKSLESHILWNEEERPYAYQCLGLNNKYKHKELIRASTAKVNRREIFDSSKYNEYRKSVSYNSQIDEYKKCTWVRKYRNNSDS